MNEYRRWVGRLAGGFCLFDGRQTTDQTQTPEETLGAPYDAGATRQCSCRQRIDRRSTVHRPSWRGWRLESGEKTARAPGVMSYGGFFSRPEANGSRFEVQPMGGSCELRGELSTGLPSFNHGTTATARQACDAKDDPTGQPTHGLGPTETAEPAIGPRRRRIEKERRCDRIRTRRETRRSE